MSLEQHITMLDVFQADGVTKPAAAALPLARTTCLGDVITDEELVIRRPDGRWITVSCNAGPIWDAEGHITHGVIAWRDITHLERVEEALRWETQFRLLFEQAAVGIEVVDLEDGHLCTVNVKSYDMLGYTEQDLIGRSFRDFTAVEDLPEEERLLGRLVAGDISSYTLEKRYLHKDGAARWVRLTSSIVRHPSLPQAFRLSVVEDVTERKIAELALRHALAEAPFPVMLHAEDGTVLQLSRSWTEITGYTAEDLLTIADWTERAYGARREVVRAEIDRLYAQERRTDEGEHVVTTAQGT